jgi:hypothetical protein
MRRPTGDCEVCWEMWELKENSKRFDPKEILNDMDYWGEEHFAHLVREFVEEWAKVEDKLKKAQAKLKKVKK